MVNRAVVVGAAHSSRTIEIAGAVEDHATIRKVAGSSRIHVVKHAFRPAAGRRRQLINNTLTVGSSLDRRAVQVARLIENKITKKGKLSKNASREAIKHRFRPRAQGGSAGWP